MTVTCEIVTAERTVFSGDVDYVSLPASEGVVGIGGNHSPLLTVLQFGEVYVRKDGDTAYFAVGGGFAEVMPGKVIVLADSAERADEIDLERANKARAEAQKAMDEGVPEDPEKYRMIEAALRRAQIRVDTATRRASEMRNRRGGPPQFGNN